jgi:chromate reductase
LRLGDGEHDHQHFRNCRQPAQGLLQPPGAQGGARAAALQAFDLPDLPGFNQDNEKTPPPAVAEMKTKIRAADVVQLVTPEYNYSVSGVLRNAIDWAARPYGDSAWKGKPAAIMGASAGVLGGACAVPFAPEPGIDMPTVNQPEVMIAAAASKFDPAGNLTDETAKLISQLLVNLCELARRLARP